MFVSSSVDVIPECDRPIPSKVSEHALKVAIKNVRCRKQKAKTYTVAPTVRMQSKQGQAALKAEDAVEHIARFVAGEIQVDDVTSLPGVARVLTAEAPSSSAKMEQPSAKMEPPSAKMEPRPPSAHTKVEPSQSAHTKVEPSADDTAPLTGNLEEL